VTLLSPAKINLSLRVHEKMASGYHRLESVMAKLELSDELDVEFSGPSEVTCKVPGFSELENEKNLVVRAAKAFLGKANAGTGVHVILRKRIPMGGGLGGGSSNAAMILLALNRKYKAFSEPQLIDLAAKIGADVPFFIQPSPWALAEGIGEKLTSFPDPPSIPIVLVNPGFPVSTPAAFVALKRSLTYVHPNGSSIRPENRSDLHRLLEIGNDLQAPVEEMFPVLKTIREKLKKEGASFAQMSGSGSTVFGLFDDEKGAKKAAERLISDGKWKTFYTRTRWGVDKW
jgi:4-diphosphocytidyl-2-C-methyl-D-erythritol kinase